MGGVSPPPILLPAVEGVTTAFRTRQGRLPAQGFPSLPTTSGHAPHSHAPPSLATSSTLIFKLEFKFFF